MTTLAVFFAGMFAGAVVAVSVLFAIGSASQSKAQDAAKKDGEGSEK